MARKLTDIQWIVVHCSATPADMDIGAAEIREWHLQQGWSDIGYHFVIRRDGTVEKGRNTDTPGAHAYGYNMYSLGVCLVGGAIKGSTKAENNFTPAQFLSLRVLLEQLQEIHRGDDMGVLKERPRAEILGHRDLPGVNKACPSFDVRAWWAGRNSPC